MYFKTSAFICSSMSSTAGRFISASSSASPLSCLSGVFEAAGHGPAAPSAGFAAGSAGLEVSSDDGEAGLAAASDNGDDGDGGAGFAPPSLEGDAGAGFAVTEAGAGATDDRASEGGGDCGSISLGA